VIDLALHRRGNRFEAPVSMLRKTREVDTVIHAVGIFRIEVGSISFPELLSRFWVKVLVKDGHQKRIGAFK